MLNLAMITPLFADNFDGLFWLAVGGVLVAVFVFGLVTLFTSRYKRCPSNRVLVIYGKAGGGEAAKCIHGGAKFVLPLVQDYAYLNLEPIQIEIPLRGALSMENIRVNVPSVFTVAIGTTPEVMQNAAIRLLGLDVDEIEKQADDIIFGQLRQVIASMSIEEINRDREKFMEKIQASLEAGAEENRPGADQCEHHRHHRRKRLHRRHRPESRQPGHSASPRRRGRKRANGRKPRGRGRSR